MNSAICIDVLLVSLQVVCADITKAQIETIMSELLQLYDMEAKCTWETKNEAGTKTLMQKPTPSAVSDDHLNTCIEPSFSWRCDVT